VVETVSRSSHRQPIARLLLRLLSWGCLSLPAPQILSVSHHALGVWPGRTAPGTCPVLYQPRSDGGEDVLKIKSV
jgi:hypothetical protein